MMRDVSQIERLLDMAEDVSGKITDLNEKISKIKSAMILLMIFTTFPIFLGFVFESSSLQFEAFAVIFRFVTVGFIVVLFAFLATGYRKVMHFQNAKKLELAILHDLLPMIHEYRSYLFKMESMSIECAIVDMRLKRIEYSGRY